MLTLKQIDKIIKDGGATLTPNGSPVLYKRGYQVSKKDCYILTLNRRQIASAFDSVKKLCKRSDCVGLWIDGDKIYIDISEHINSKKQAIEQGRKNKQISIFDWATGDCIYL